MWVSIQARYGICGFEGLRGEQVRSSIRKRVKTLGTKGAKSNCDFLEDYIVIKENCKENMVKFYAIRYVPCNSCLVENTSLDLGLSNLNFTVILHPLSLNI